MSTKEQMLKTATEIALSGLKNVDEQSQKDVMIQTNERMTKSQKEKDPTKEWFDALIENPDYKPDNSENKNEDEEYRPVEDVLIDLIAVEFRNHDTEVDHIYDISDGNPDPFVEELRQNEEMSHEDRAAVLLDYITFTDMKSDKRERLIPGLSDLKNEMELSFELNQKDESEEALDTKAETLVDKVFDILEKIGIIASPKPEPGKTKEEEKKELKKGMKDKIKKADMSDPEAIYKAALFGGVNSIPGGHRFVPQIGIFRHVLASPDPGNFEGPGFDLWNTVTEYNNNYGNKRFDYGPAEAGNELRQKATFETPGKFQTPTLKPDK